MPPRTNPSTRHRQKAHTSTCDQWHGMVQNSESPLRLLGHLTEQQANPPQPLTIYGNMGFWVGLPRVLAAARPQVSQSFQFWVGLLRVLAAARPQVSQSFQFWVGLLRVLAAARPQASQSFQFWVGLLRVLAAARPQVSQSFQFWVGLLRVLAATAFELKVKNFILQDPNT